LHLVFGIKHYLTLEDALKRLLKNVKNAYPRKQIYQRHETCFLTDSYTCVQAENKVEDT
jgi:hypothetical protein